MVEEEIGGGWHLACRVYTRRAADAVLSLRMERGDDDERDEEETATAGRFGTEKPYE